MKNLSRAAIVLCLGILAGSLIINSALAIEKIDINSASYEELQKIIWVGPATAKRIIEARPFFSLDELTRIKGISEAKVEDIKKQGLAWVDSKLKSTEETGLKIAETESSKKELTAVGEQIPKEDFHPFLPLFAASAIAIFSGAIILILKRKIKDIDLSKKLE